MWIKIQNSKLYVIKLSVLLLLVNFVNSENATDIDNPDAPNIKVTSYPFRIEFHIEDSSYTIINVECKSKSDEINIDEGAICNKLEPCSSYHADLLILYTNSSNSESTIIKRRIMVKTSYSEPKVKLMQNDFITKPYSIFIKWNVKYQNCVNLFKIKAAAAESKVYMDIQNDKNNATFLELSPCLKYDIEIVTLDINNEVIEPNLTTISETDYVEPGSVHSLSFETISSKSVQVSWKTPNYTTCVKFYFIKWIKENCVGSESCKWENFTVQNPKSTDYVIDNLEGCEKYKLMISTNNGELLNSNIIGNFTSPEQRPGPITNFSNDRTATNTTINWELPKENGQCVTIYKIDIIGPLQNIEFNKTFKTIKRRLFFDDLKPCGIYNISITAISNGNLISDTVKNSITMMHAKPNAIRNLYVKYYYPHEIILDWQKPNFSELCIDYYRISGWSNDDDSTKYNFNNQTNTTSKQISDLVSCMTYIVQIIPVIIGSEPSFDGNPTQLKVETIASTTSKPSLNNLTVTSHSIEVRAINNDQRNFCPILMAKFECTAKDARINYIEKIVEESIANTYLAILEPLSPFTSYTCQIYFYNTGGKSLAATVVKATDKYYPEEPTDVKAVIANNSLYINWNKPIYLNGDLVFYKVFIQIIGPKYNIPSHCKPIETKNIFFEHSKSDYEYKDIHPYNQYSIQIAAKNDFGTGKTTNPIFITSQPSVSNPVENFKYISIDGPEIGDVYNASILLEWLAPCQSNGIIKLYELKFYGTRNGFNDHYIYRQITSNQINETSKSVKWKELDLQPEYNYTVSVKIEIIGVEQKSEGVSISFSSPAGIPEFVNNTNSGEVDAFSSDNPTKSALVKIPINIFQSNMGKIIYAAVLLSEIGCQDDPKLISGKINIDNNWPNISSWQEVGSQECISQYQTTPERWQPFINSKSFSYKNDDDSENINTVIKYIIGNENNCNAEKLYCNGPLKSNTKYKMILRVFTRNGFADTISLQFKTDDVVKIYMILIMVVSVLLVAFFLGFIYMWINKRKIWYRQSLNGIEDQCGDVTTRNYFQHYHDLSKKDKILREFKDLDVVSNDTNSKNIITRYNDLKNRYSNIFPYENNRVILDIDSDGSDYINASFINGYKRKKEYIATQGPKPESFIDFWKMIIQHNVRVIVMLTQLREGSVVKCHQYFPTNSNEMKFGHNITVYCKREVENDIYERRDMIIKHSGDHIYRTVIHYYFKKWPDHDCPIDAMDLITFVKRVKSEKLPNRSPIVVHCSAGVGRTGTFIGLDIILQRMKNEGKINIYETIKQLRFERMKMVQTIQQYQFLYHCLYQLVFNKYSRDSKKNSLITNSSTTTVITAPPTPALPGTPSTLSLQLSLPYNLPTPTIPKSVNCNGNKNNSDTVSSKNSFYSQNEVESAM